MKIAGFALLFSAVLLSGPAMHGQVPPQDRAPGGRLSLDVVVMGKDGVPVGGLTQQDFEVKDNKTLRTIAGFQAVAGSSEPVEVILVIDAVNVNFIHLADERSRVERFLKKNEGLPSSTALAVFTDEGLQLQNGYTTNGKELSDALDHFVTGLRTTRRSSQDQAEDRFNLSIKALTQLLAHEATRPGRKLIFWVTPGWPLLAGPEINLSGKQQDSIFQEIVSLSMQMQRAHVTLYSLNPLGVEEGVARSFAYQEFLKGVPNAGRAEIGDLGLQVLATQSGGLSLNSSNDLERELATCFAEAKASYTISFEGAHGEAANEYHHLEVTVVRPGLIARTRDGYYAQP